MTDQSSTPSPSPNPPPAQHGGSRRGLFALVFLAVAVVAGLTGNMLTTAFGQGFAWRAWHGGVMGGGMMGGGFMGGPLTPAQIDDRIDRMTKHMAIELDASADQQAKIASIAKAAVNDLRPMREKAQAARGQAIALLTAPTVDRTAIERLRADQIALAETASKRIAQAVADASEVLSPEQRRKVADWAAAFNGGPWGPWHRG
jgi:periplasmic protein CpxP/Spy